MSYRIEFAPQVQEHLRVLTSRQRSTLFDVIRVQLVTSPLVETRNRKPMRSNPLAPWELRIGDLRVYYGVEAGSPEVVRILAVGKTPESDTRRPRRD